MRWHDDYLTGQIKKSLGQKGFLCTISNSYQGSFQYFFTTPSTTPFTRENT